MSYGIIFGSSVKKDIRRLPTAVVEKIQEALRSLQENPFPHHSTLLQGYEKLNHSALKCKG